MESKIFRFFDTSLHLKRGEKFNIFLLQASIFLIIMVLLILKSVFTSLMLFEYGISVMPKAFIIIGLIAVLVHYIINKSLSPQKVFRNLITNQILQILILIGISISIYQEFVPIGSSIALYVYISIYALVSVTFFYQYLQSLFSIREAKTIYPYIGSAAIAGAISGGYITSILVNKIGNVGLIVLTSILLIFCTLLIIYFSKRHKEGLSINNQHKPPHLPELVENSFVGVLKNKHVKYLSIIIGCGVLASKLIDFQFNYMLMTKIGGEAELTSFLGFWYSNINVIGFLIQVLATKYLLDRFGVHTTMSFLPILVIIGSITLLLFPVLGVAIIGKTIDGSLKQSIYKTTTEINIMPLHFNLRNRAKTFIDVVIDSAATGLAGVLIIVYNQYVSLDLIFITYSIIVVCIVWIIGINKSTDTYKRSLSSKLSMFKLDGNNNSEKTKKVSLPDDISINEIVTTKSAQTLKNLIKYDNPLVRAFALERYIEVMKSKSLPELIMKSKDQDLNVRRVAFYGLVQFAKTEEDLDELYTYADVKGRILLTESIVYSLDKSIKSHKFYNIYERIHEEYAELIFLDQESDENLDEYFGIIFTAILMTFDKVNYDLVLKALQNVTNTSMQNQAILAIEQSKNLYFFDILLDIPVVDSNKTQFDKAVGQYPSLTLPLIKKSYSTNKILVLKLLPSLIYIESQKAVNVILQLIFLAQTPIKIEAIKIYNAYKARYPDYRYKSLKTSMKIINELDTMSSLSETTFSKLNINKNVLNSAENKSFNLENESQLLKTSITNLIIYLNVHYNDKAMMYTLSHLFTPNKNLAFDYLDSILSFKAKRRIIPKLEEAVNIIQKVSLQN